jgi:hypothetical protein
MKKLLILLFSILISFTSFPIYAEDFLYTCISNEGNFVTTDRVDTSAKTILHVSSYIPGTEQTIKTNKYRKIIEWNYPLVFSYTLSSIDNYPNFQLFHFGNLTKSSSGYYEDKEPDSLFLQCFKS